MNDLNNFRLFLIEHEETKKALAEANAKLATIEAKSIKRAESVKRSSKLNPEEKKVSKVLRIAQAKLPGQAYNDSVTLSRIIDLTMTKNECGKYEFFSVYNKRVRQMINYKPFVDNCTSNGLNLDPNIVAQHIVVKGVSTMNSVFKDGLISVVGEDKLRLMDKPIFTEKDLDLDQYRPISHPDSE